MGCDLQGYRGRSPWLGSKLTFGKVEVLFNCFWFLRCCSRMGGENQHVVSGLLQKRSDLEKENAECRERMALIANDIQAIDRVLNAFGYSGPLEGRTPRAARIILFYRTSFGSSSRPSYSALGGLCRPASLPSFFARPRAATRRTGACSPTLPSAPARRSAKCGGSGSSHRSKSGVGRLSGALRPVNYYLNDF